MYAKAIGETVKSTTPPMCVGIIGTWGSGKSFLIELLKLEFDPFMRMRESNDELVQWFEDDYNDCLKINKENEEVDVRPLSCGKACCYRWSLLIPVWNVIYDFFIRSFSVYYLVATICQVIYSDVLIFVNAMYRFVYMCWYLTELRDEISNNDLEAQPLLLQLPTKENIVVNFNALIFNKTDELWVALIRELYRVVELRLSKSPKHPKVKNQRDYKLLWRVEKAIKLLIENYGGDYKLRLYLYFAIISLLGFVFIIIMKLSGLVDLWNYIVGRIGNIWVTIISSLAAIPSLKFFYDIITSASISRGEALFTEASNIKDSIGFMEKNQQELNDLFNFLNKYKKDTDIELRILLFIDDLDRCTINGRNVMLLEAIQLLLNIQGAPVIVFLAIDTRIIATSIETALNTSMNINDAMISGHEYLEKIIQLPFCLPEPPREKIKTFIGSCIRPYKVDILFVARQLKTFLNCIKRFMDNEQLKDDCCLEIFDESLKKGEQYRRISFIFLLSQLQPYLNEKPSLTDDRRLLLIAADLLTISTLTAAKKYITMSELQCEDFCHSILNALTNTVIVRSTKDENKYNGIIKKIYTSLKQKKTNNNRNWTFKLNETYKAEFRKNNYVKSILYDYNLKMERFSTLIPTEFIPFLNSFCQRLIVIHATLNAH